MMRRSLGIGLRMSRHRALLRRGIRSSQTDRFEAADVHVSPRSDNNFNLFMRGPQTRGGQI